MIFNLLLIFVATQIDVSAEIELADGKKIQSAIAGIDQGKVSGDKLGEGIPWTQITKIRLANPNKKIVNNKIRVAGLGQSVIGGDRAQLKKGNLLVLDSNGNVSVSLPRPFVQTIQLDLDVESSRWENAIANAPKADALVIERDGRLDLLDGVVKALNDEEVTFEIRGRSANVKLAKLAGILFFHSPTQRQSPFKFIDTRNNVVYFDEIRFDGKVFFLKHQKHVIEFDAKVASVIDCSAGYFTTLESLTPQSSDWKPFLKARIGDPELQKLIETLRKNKIVWTRNESFGKPIMMDFKSKVTRENPVGRVMYDSGISILGGTQLVFEIPQNSKFFKADLGIQSSANGMGDIDFQVEIDGQSVFKKQIKATDNDVLKLNIPVSGKRIKFIVGYGPQNNVGDIISLGNPRFGKR